MHAASRALTAKREGAADGSPLEGERRNRGLEPVDGQTQEEEASTHLADPEAVTTGG